MQSGFCVIAAFPARDPADGECRNRGLRGALVKLCRQIRENLLHF